MRIANVAEEFDDSVEDALTQTVAADHRGLAARAEPDPTGVDGGVIVGLALDGRGPRRRRHRRGRGSCALALAEGRRPRASPRDVRAQIATLKALSAEYAAVGASGNQVAAQTGQEIAVLADNADRAVRAAGRAQRRRPAQHRGRRVRRQAAQAHGGAQPRLPPRHPDPPAPLGRPGRSRAGGAGAGCTRSRPSSSRTSSRSTPGGACTSRCRSTA